MSELLYEKQGMIAKIIINRPEKRNALNSAVIHGIDEALKQAAEDPKVRVVILGGAGEKAFTAGFDLKEAMEHNITGVVERRKDTSEEIKFFMRMWNFPKPIVAAIQGYCIGGGITLAMLSDMVIASEDASFGNPEIILGYVPEFPMEVWKMPFNKVREFFYLSKFSRSFFADSSYMLSFSVLCSCVCSRLISPSVSSWHKQDNTLMHQSPGHIQRRTPYNF